MWKLMTILCIAFSTQLSAEIKVLAFSGSTREGSVNKKLVLEAARLARQMGASVTIIDLKDFALPFYDGDLEIKAGIPEKAKELRQLMIQNQMIFISSPEYNGSLSAVLKNAIDWATRSENGGSSREAFKGKRFLIMSASPGSTGGTRGLVHLRTILENIGGIVLPQQFALPEAYNAFDEQGLLKDPNLKNQFQLLIQSAITQK